MAPWKYLLLPLAGLYNMITRIRNHLYDIGHKKSFQFDTVVISVGNLNVGGSGKTPMIEYLIHLLSPHYKLAILSRGYGRKTIGFRMATPHDSAGTLGDEPFQIYRKFGKEVVVAVGEERALAIPTILHEHPEVQLILLDDAFQHRAVVPQISILVTDYSKPFFQDFVLPFGRLREARVGAARADVVVVTKCPGLTESVEQSIKSKVATFVGSKPIFFMQQGYRDPEPIGHTAAISNTVILVSGIANSSSLEQHLASRFKVIKHFRFADHHHYTHHDLEVITKFARDHEGTSLVTTEKDMVKLIEEPLRNLLEPNRWFYIPLHTHFVKDGSEFDTLITTQVESARKAVTWGTHQ